MDNRIVIEVLVKIITKLEIGLTPFITAAAVGMRDVCEELLRLQVAFRTKTIRVRARCKRRRAAYTAIYVLVVMPTKSSRTTSQNPTRQ